MEKLLKIILTVIAAVFGSRNTYACMCSPSHPQKSLCRNGTFAAMVKVRNIEYVYTTERPKYRKPQKLEDGVIQKHPADDAKDMVDVATKPEMEHVEVVVKDLKQLSQKHFVASHIRYRVKVYETYKGLKQDEVQGKKVYIYTAPQGSACGVTLEQQEMYLLIGNIYEDRLTIGLCSHYVSWNSLNSKQRKVVRRNMRGATSTCKSSCQIQLCFSSCPKSDKNLCQWSSHKERLSAKLNIHPANYVCTREHGNQDSRCIWNDPLNTLKRGRRRRRHHESLLSQISLPVDEGRLRLP